MKSILIITASCAILLTGCRLLTGFNFSEISQSNSAFSNQEILTREISNLLFQEENCMLPCFAGLTPGESTVEEIERLLRQFDIYESTIQMNQFRDTYNLSLFPNSEGLLSIGFTTEDNILTRTSIGISNVHTWLPITPYNLPDIFNTYGKPDNIFISIAGPPLSFSLVIPYNEQGFMLRYRAFYENRNLVEQGKKLPVCLHRETVDLQQIELWLQNPDEIESVENNQPDLYDEREIRPWWTIERAASVTVDEFVDFFMTNPEACFLLPALRDLRSEGYVP